MKIRIMGTRDECNLATKYYHSLEKEEYVKSVQVSRFYANKGSSTIFRLYVDVEYRDGVNSDNLLN